MLEYDVSACRGSPRAIEDKKLDVLVLGAGSSMLPGADGVKMPIRRGCKRRLIEGFPACRSK